METTQNFGEIFEELSSETKEERESGQKKLQAYTKLILETNEKTGLENFTNILAAKGNGSFDVESADWNLCVAYYEVLISYLEIVKALGCEKPILKELIDIWFSRLLASINQNDYRVVSFANSAVRSIINVDLTYQHIFMENSFQMIWSGLDMPVSDPKQINNAKDILNASSGWKLINTGLTNLTFVFTNFDNEDVIINFNIHAERLCENMDRILLYDNRFVREALFVFFDSLFRFYESKISTTDMMFGYEKLLYWMKIGQCDNWSQVRMASCIATRTFLNIMKKKMKIGDYVSILPVICLNRHYLAEGVKFYSRETWKLLLGQSGIEVVQVYIDDFVKYYNSQLDADNHAVREAVCHCLTELLTLVDLECVSYELLYSISESIHKCFSDDSWPVRDTACLSFGIIAIRFGFKYSKLMDYIVTTIFPLILENLMDFIPSVRCGAALTLARMYVVVPDAVELLMYKHCDEKLYAASEQQSETDGLRKFDGSTFGVVKNAYDNKVDIHTNQQMFSCGSLAPKMKKKGYSGCSGHSFRQPAEKWELSDGCVTFLGVLSYYFCDTGKSFENISLPSSKSDKIDDEIVSSLIIKITKFCKTYLCTINKLLKERKYFKHTYLLQNIFDYLPSIIVITGKKEFKQLYFDEDNLIEAISYSLSFDDKKKFIASVCSFIDNLGKIYGKNIVYAKLDQFCGQYSPIYKNNAN